MAQIGDNNLADGSVVVAQGDRLIQNPRCPICARNTLQLDAPPSRARLLVDLLEHFGIPPPQRDELDAEFIEPTFVLTNQLRRSAIHLVGRYAQRMLIENGIADGVDFFHMDAPFADGRRFHTD